MADRSELIEEKARALIEAINNNVTSLWNPQCDHTHECVMLDGGTVTCDDEPDKEYPGIEKEIKALEDALSKK